MSGKPRLSLKLSDKTSGSGSPSTPTIKLRLPIGSGSKASTPVEPSAPPTSQGTSPETVKKAQRARKPSAKVLAANANGKRDHSDTDDDNLPARSAKKTDRIKISIKQKTPSTPVGVKLKVKGKPPVRPFGEGYDSEASDRELDPSIEEQFVIRFDDRLISSSGADCSDDCSYIHQMIKERKIGAGAEISFLFLENDGRRASVTVRKTHYAATLVDMPTITESMKSFDRRTWMKTADVSQMLLVFARIDNIDEAKTIDLPRDVNNKTYEFPHGLTPPLRFARHRRFRPRTRRNDIEEVENQVNALLEQDKKAIKSTYEWFDPDAASRDASQDASRAITEDADEQQYEDENADAEGEIDDSLLDGSAVYNQNGLDTNSDGGVVDLEDELENALAKESEEAATPGTEAATPMIEVEANTPVLVEEDEAESESEDDSGDEDDDDDDGEEEIDEEERAKRAALAEQLEDIAALEKQVEQLQSQLRSHSHPIIRGRLQTSLETTKSELMLKKAAIEGIDEES